MLLKYIKNNKEITLFFKNVNIKKNFNKTLKIKKLIYYL